MNMRCFRDVLFGRRAERGQVLILFAAGLVGLLGLIGAAIDVGQVVTTRTNLQKTADAAALAGSLDLPGSTNAAHASALHYAALNASSTSPQVTFPDNSTIEVRVSKRVNYTFLRALGLSGTDVSARAVARGTNEIVTGYHLHSTAPFLIWGGSRQNIPGGSAGCELLVCVGQSYEFLGNQWMNGSGDPTAPDWTANDSNNFNGVIDHGAGNPVIHVGDSMTVTSPGGLGSVDAPAIGTKLIIPVVERASGNSDGRTFVIAAWAYVQVDPSCKKQKCTGTILGPSEAPPGGVVGGSVAPPSHLYQTQTESRLVN